MFYRQKVSRIHAILEVVVDYARWGYSTMISEIRGERVDFFQEKLQKFFSDLGFSGFFMFSEK